MDSYSQQYEDEMWDAIAASDRGPARSDELALSQICVTPLRAYPGWEIREYTNGAFVAWQRLPGLAVSSALSSFREAVAWVRTQA